MGLVAIIAGIVLLTSATSALAVVLEALLAAAGLDLAVTGTLGHYPLYAKLDYLPKSLRRSRSKQSTSSASSRAAWWKASTRLTHAWPDHPRLRTALAEAVRLNAEDFKRASGGLGRRDPSRLR